MIPSQMLKGILESCILKIISSKETYGYEISRKLNEYDFGDISEGTIYPLMLRLEKNMYVTTTYNDSKTGPRRKYYHITDKGKQELVSFEKHWREMETAVNNLFEGGKHNAK